MPFDWMEEEKHTKAKHIFCESCGMSAHENYSAFKFLHRGINGGRRLLFASKRERETIENCPVMESDENSSEDRRCLCQKTL